MTDAFERAMHELCRDWGRYCRLHPEGFPRKSMEHKLFYGEVSLPASSTSPEWQQDADVIECHRAWRQLPEDLKMAAWGLYVLQGDASERAARVGMSQAGMYNRRRALWSRLALVMQGDDIQNMKGKLR